MTTGGTAGLAALDKTLRAIVAATLFSATMGSSLLAIPSLAATTDGGGPAASSPGKLALVEFQSSPFPYHGNNPGLNRPFLDVNSNNRLGHTSVRGGVYWEDETYSDRRTLLFVPTGFDIHRPGVIIVFFHGNQSTLERDVSARQQVPSQIAGSGLNAVLVAPQFAVDALDSSPGHFWEPGAFRRYLDEAAAHLGRMYGDGDAAAHFAEMPVVLVAYSGGYLPAAYAVAGGGVDDRLVGLVLLDALYGEVDKFADWIARHAATGTGFFFSAYSGSSADTNAALQATLSRRRIGFTVGLPNRLTRSSIAFIKVDDSVGHNDFVSAAWTKDPLSNVLSKLPGFAKERPEIPVASLANDHQRASVADPDPTGAVGPKPETPAALPTKKLAAGSVLGSGAGSIKPIAAAEADDGQDAAWSTSIGHFMIGIGASGFILTLIIASFSGVFARRRWR